MGLMCFTCVVVKAIGAAAALLSVPVVGVSECSPQTWEPHVVFSRCLPPPPPASPLERYHIPHMYSIYSTTTTNNNNNNNNNSKNTVQVGKCASRSCLPQRRCMK